MTMPANKKINFKKPEWLRKKLTPTAQREMEGLLKDVWITYNLSRSKMSQY